MLRDKATESPRLPVLINFEKTPVEPGTKQQILRVLVGPGPDLDVAPLEEFSARNRPSNKLANDAIPSSCNSGKASVVFLKLEGNILVKDTDLTCEDAIVGITEIATGAQKYPIKIVYSEAFYTFSPANRKAFAKLFC